MSFFGWSSISITPSPRPDRRLPVALSISMKASVPWVTATRSFILKSLSFVSCSFILAIIVSYGSIFFMTTGSLYVRRLLPVALPPDERGMWNCPSPDVAAFTVRRRDFIGPENSTEPVAETFP